VGGGTCNRTSEVPERALKETISVITPVHRPEGFSTAETGVEHHPSLAGGARERSAVQVSRLRMTACQNHNDEFNLPLIQTAFHEFELNPLEMFLDGCVSWFKKRD
jgi:hypothetical protein